ncbi:MAG: hypothetical protein MSH30_02730 [Campylobacter sp.]|nr:hypothetical protein [Campylobacter sp.]MCI7362232.1 hypothetical protein [Campylobacter sp.]
MSAIKTKRIALNETARAYNDARAFEYANSSDIQVVKIQMSITHPRTDICDYYAGVDKYELGAGVYPKDKVPVPPFHPFCRCQMIPKYADEYSKPKLNANADKEYLLGLKEWQRARILGSKAKADEALKTGDVASVFNAMKPKRYKVKSINEVAGNLAIISALKEVNDMIKLNGTIKNNQEVINTLKELAGVDLINGEFKAQINHNQREKLISNRAISKSENNGFSRQEHLIAVANIDKLFKGARLLGRFDDIKHGQKDIKILRFEKYCIFGNKIAKCLITAKETKNHKMHKINIYSLELSAN